jgi:hypothetical protein
VSRARHTRTTEILDEPNARLAPPPEIAEAIARAAESIGVGPAPVRRASGWPSGSSYVWRFSGVAWARQVTARRDRP